MLDGLATLLLFLVGLSFLEVTQIIVEMTNMMSKITRTAPPLAVPITIALAGRLAVLGEGVGCGVLTTLTDMVVEEGERDGVIDGDGGGHVNVPDRNTVMHVFNTVELV